MADRTFSILYWLICNIHYKTMSFLFNYALYLPPNYHNGQGRKRGIGVKKIHYNKSQRSVLVLFAQGVSVQGVYVLGGRCPGGKCLGVYVPGDKCPRG